MKGWDAHGRFERKHVRSNNQEYAKEEELSLQ